MGRTSDANIRLTRAALELLWEESYGAVTIDDICKRADVKKGSFYYFFQSKSDLACAAIDWLWENEWKPSLDRIYSASVEPLQRIANHLESAYHRHAQMKLEHGKVLGCPIVSVGSEMSTQDERLGQKVREICARKRRYYESAIRDAVATGSIEPCDVTRKAQCLAGLIEGIITQARIHNDPELIRPLPQLALDMLHTQKTAPAA